MARLPAVATSFDARRFLGIWYIVATSYGFWKRRIHPTVTYGEVAGDPRALSDRLDFEVRKPWRGSYEPAVLEGIDRQDGEPGRFVWRGRGLLRVIRSRWCVVAVGEQYDWAVTYFARSNVGTAPGVDIYARTAALPAGRVREILSQVSADPFLAEACTGMFATVQKGGAATPDLELPRAR
jgi:hypothetical protein